jgi:hypothetical protein
MQLPVALGVTGSYANLVSFFQSLEKLPRAMLVAGWSMCPIVATTGSASGASSGGGCTVPSVPTNKTPPTGTLGASLNATVFYSPPAAATTGLTPSTTTSTPAASTAAAS